MPGHRISGRALMAVVIAALVFAPATLSVRAAQSPQVPLAGKTLAQFVDPLPVLDLAGGPMLHADGTAPLTVRMCEFKSNVLPTGFIPPAGGTYNGTWVWGYLPDPTGTSTCADLIAQYGTNGTLGTYIGPVVLAQRDTPTQITWINDLGTTDTTNVLAWKYSTDQTLHWADPLNDEANECNHMGGVPAAGSPCAQNYSGPIPAVTHLHGGEVPDVLDGGPDAWFTSDGSHQGHSYYTKSPGVDSTKSAVYAYPNTQEAAPLWFHDHLLGATRLNVYAGLAGAYLLADPNLALPTGLHAYGLDRGGQLDPTVPLVIQDRMFDTNGQLFMPADSAGGVLSALNPEHPYWVPEFMGDTIVVNGKAWPRFDVEPKRYRFLVLNGSNARTYELSLTDPVSKNVGPAIWVIGTDGGYLDAPVKVDPVAGGKLVSMPGERYEVIVDFSGYQAGAIGPNGVAYSGQWLLRNTAKTPYPAGMAPQGTTTARIMQFNVGACATGQCGAADTSYDPASLTPLRPGMVRLANPATGALSAGVTVQKTRQLTLNEVMAPPKTAIDPVTGVSTAYPGGPLEVLVNNTTWGGGVDPMTGTCSRTDFTPVTVGGDTACYSELPREGDTELWEIVNTTADAHPIHLHLVQFQIVNRQNYNTNTYPAAYGAAFTGGAYVPGSGPPRDYDPALNPLSGGKYGGNPDVGLLGKNGKPVYLQGPAVPPAAAEAGWKDTVVALPGQVTRIAVRWAPTSLPVTAEHSELVFPFDPANAGGYVWHCHIIDHEDNEMMRPTQVLTDPNTVRAFVQGTDY